MSDRNEHDLTPDEQEEASLALFKVGIAKAYAQGQRDAFEKAARIAEAKAVAPTGESECAVAYGIAAAIRERAALASQPKDQGEGE